MVDFPREQDGPVLFRLKDTAAFLGMSRSTIDRHDKTGAIPRPVRIGNGRRWRRDELRRWIEAGSPSRERWEEMNR